MLRMVAREMCRLFKYQSRSCGPSSRSACRLLRVEQAVHVKLIVGLFVGAERCTSAAHLFLFKEHPFSESGAPLWRTPKRLASVPCPAAAGAGGASGRGQGRT